VEATEEVKEAAAEAKEAAGEANGIVKAPMEAVAEGKEAVVEGICHQQNLISTSNSRIVNQGIITYSAV
jgi:hypothetical protein